MILLVDNYDSFSHNLARYFTLLGQTVKVVRNDVIDAATATRMPLDALVLSPGPGTPEQAGCSLALVRQLHMTVPVLGVCLGHQIIVAAFGGTVARSNRPVHGRASTIMHDRQGVFADVPNPTVVGRYHALVAMPERLPDVLHVSARTSDGTIMAVRHRDLPIVGLQFHPESILTEHGFQILRNFLAMAGLTAQCGGQQ